jgi:hypothetical protein
MRRLLLGFVLGVASGGAVAEHAQGSFASTGVHKTVTEG